MKTNTSVALIYWDTKIGGVSTSIPSLAARLLRRPSTNVSVFLKRQNTGTHLVTDRQAQYHYFSKNVYSGHKIRFAFWLFYKLLISKPDYIIVFLNRFTLVAVLYQSVSSLFSRKPIIFVGQVVVASAYLRQYESWYWKPILMGCFARVDGIIVNTNAIAEDLCQNFLVPSAKIRLIKNWVTPAPLALLMKKHYDCIFVGRLSPEKGIETILDTVEFCLKKLPGFSLAIVGDGILKDWLLKSIQERGLTHCISFLGYQKNPRTFMQQARLLLLPSYNEGLPMVILEAYSVGVPAVVTPFLGADEAVENGKTGVIAGRSDFPSAVLGLLGNRKKLTGMGKAARTKAKKDFGMQNLDRFVETIFSARRAT